MQPPVAPQRPHVHREHGVERPDPYHWLRERDDKEVLAYLEAENEYTEAYLDSLSTLKQRLYDEMLGRVQETDQSAAIPRGAFAYYTRTEDGKAYAIHARRPVNGGTEVILLDENTLAEGHDFFHLGAMSVSPNHQRLAYAVDTNGSEIHTVVVIDIATREILDTWSGAVGDVVWGHNDETVYWTEPDATQRPYRIRRHTIGSTDDPIVFEDLDARFYVWIERTRPGRFLKIITTHSETSEVHLIDTDGVAKVVRPREAGRVYDVDVGHQSLWIRTNDGHDDRLKSPDYRLYQADPNGDWSDWTVAREPTEGRSLEGVECFATHRVLVFREDGHTHFEVHERATGAIVVPSFPDPVYVAGFSSTPDYDSPAFHYTYASPVQPSSVRRVQFDDESTEILKVQPVPGYQPDDYHCERRFAVAADGTRIPVSVLWKGDAPSDRPCFLYGYGSYGITVEPTFRSRWVSLLDREFVIAIAHPRGGGFLGRAWYEAAKFTNKARTFEDFIAVGRALIETGVTSSDKLALMGGSAGGLLMGAVMNRAPDLAKAVIARVPFVDVISTMLDADLPLTAGEWEEWGNPRDRDIFEAMQGYSPYDNLHSGPYPDLLVTSGLNDPRVQYWEPTKWVAQLRNLAPTTHVLLKTHMGAGHQGSSGRYGYLKDSAGQFAWMLSRLDQV